MHRHLPIAALLVWPLLGILVLAGRTSSAPAPPAGETSAGPRYDAEGRLQRPAGYERWIFVGASFGLSYSEHVRPGGSDTFHHVYLDPNAYAHFARTGSFPDPTLLVLEIHRRAERAAPARQGYFEGERLAVEVALKDSSRFEDGWAYFDFSNGKAASLPFEKHQCFSCHVEHAADDNVFTQFYPVLRRLKGARETHIFPGSGVLDPQQAHLVRAALD